MMNISIVYEYYYGQRGGIEKKNMAALETGTQNNKTVL